MVIESVPPKARAMRSNVATDGLPTPLSIFGEIGLVYSGDCSNLFLGHAGLMAGGCYGVCYDMAGVYLNGSDGDAVLVYCLDIEIYIVVPYDAVNAHQFAGEEEFSVLECLELGTFREE